MGKTLDVARDRVFDTKKTVLPVEIARGVYIQNVPSLQALKLMHFMIASAGGRMAEDIQHHMRLSDIRKIEGMRNHDRASLMPLFTELSSAVLIYDDTVEKLVTIGGLLEEAQIDYRHETSGDLLVSWFFGRTFRRVADLSNHWALIDRQTVFHLTSKYSVLLFQHISSLTGMDKINAKTFSIPELRAALGVSKGKLERFSNFNQKAIMPAIEEINEHSRFKLTATPRKIGRTVAGVEIGWIVKEDPVPPKPTMTGEKPVASRPFPAHGGLRFGEQVAGWRQLAETHVKRLPGDHIPDLNNLADQFRAWCARKSIPLDGSGTEKAFIGFCKRYSPPP